MKDALFVAASNIVPAVFAGISGFLAINGKPGWGWFMFASIITFTVFSRREK